MPYITQAERHQPHLWDLESVEPQTAGELSYCISKLIYSFLRAKGKPSFRTYSEALGALRASELEFYLHDVAPYELVKRTQNGDVA